MMRQGTRLQAHTAIRLCLRPREGATAGLTTRPVSAGTHCTGTCSPFKGANRAFCDPYMQDYNG